MAAEKKNPNKWGETKGAEWVGHTPPLLMIQPWKKKESPQKRGKRTRMGAGSTPINEKKKDKEAVCGMHAAS